MKNYLKVFENRRMLFTLILGFASGLPLALTGQAMQAWLTMDQVDTATIGFFTLVAQPYSYKYLWSPLMDRFEPPLFGRRRGWLIFTQFLLAGIIFIMSLISPSQQSTMFSIVAVFIAFISASQDIVIDAYRTDLLSAEERGAGAALGVLGYRLAMLVSGGLAFIWADHVGWSSTYQLISLIMLTMAVLTIFSPKLSLEKVKPTSEAKQDLLGFLNMIVFAVGGFFVGRYLLILGFSLNPNDESKWIQLLFVIIEILFALPFSYIGARIAKFQTLLHSLHDYFDKKGAWHFLLLIILFKLGDAFAGSLGTNFLLKGVGFTQIEVGTINKIFGLIATLGGALLGGALMVRLRLFKSLLFFAVLQALSNLGFWYLSVAGKGAWGEVLIPGMSIQIDPLLLTVVMFENVTGGMGTAAFVALIMSLCSSQFTATQYALLSAFAAVGRIYVGPVSGVLAVSLGWPVFFLFSLFAALPGIGMVLMLKSKINKLEFLSTGGAAEND
ncbi:MAG TPA: MFS transporter [Pseudobdellovibrionaceae bacterium]|nr:MFS transporter [Pseudobdellovibrionaceae bacterium]